MRRTSLATRISLLSIGVAVITAVFAGALATGLIRNSSSATAQHDLAKLADVAQSSVPGGLAGQARVRRALQGLKVRAGIIRPNGQLAARAELVRAAVTATDIADVLGGKSVSATRTVAGNTVFVEARPIDRGGVVLVERRTDAVAQTERAVRRIIISVLIAGGLATVVGLLVAWRLARPLRRTSAAAHSLAAGHRDVTLPAEGPTEVVEVSEAINALAGALRHSEARQREFLLSVSHDLRTPLTAISGYAESLAEGVVPPDETGQVGSVLLGEARRLERLVGDLLDLARLGAQDFRMQFAPVDLVALVQATVRAWTDRAAAAGIELRAEVPDGQIWTTTDASRLRQAVDGLFDNALRVTPAGAPIVLATRVEGDRASVELRDGGPGLADADLPVAFEQGVLFERYRGVRQVGSGLGLAIVHALVQRLGGTIEAGHALERGARFTIRLPLHS